MWPQWPYDETAHHAKPVGDSVVRWPPKNVPKKPEPGQVLSPKELEKVRTQLHKDIFQDMYKCDWGSWERRFWQFKERAIPYNEVTYVMLMHGYLLSHRHPAENAYLVLDEMRQAETHPALQKLSKRLLDSAMELRELNVLPQASRWLNVVRLCWHSSVRFQKKRKRRLREELEALEPDEVLALSKADAQRWLRRHDRAELPPTEGPARFLALPQSSQDDATATSPQLALPSPRGRRSSRSRGNAAPRGELDLSHRGAGPES